MPLETSPSRSKSIKILKDRLSKLETIDGRLSGVNFKPKRCDAFIVTPHKCGTTWLQQIVHSLRSVGDLNFEEISAVIPHIETAFDCGIDLAADQSYLPRCFKSHLWFRDIPKGAGYYIFAVREPKDAAVSYYNYLAGWFFKKDEISIDEFVEDFLLRRGAPNTPMENASYWDNLLSWYAGKNYENTLWLHYEDLYDNLSNCVCEIAEFLEIEDGDGVKCALASQQASFLSMKELVGKYDAHILKNARNVECGLPPDAGLGSNAKVNTGRVGSFDGMLSNRTIDLIDGRWEQVFRATGCSTYNELRTALNKEYGRIL